MSAEDRFRRLEALFHELEELSGPAREQLLAELEQTDPSLHAELIGLLAGTRAEAAQLIDGLAVSSGTVLDEAGRAPEQIGPYRITGLLGEGGMGRVFEAEQTEPVKRKVALKLARAGLASDTARERFLAERQALAVLDHPNIAKVFDAGSTETGQLWFAMERVNGVPITEWVRSRQLDLKALIELFLPICDAVQHAHQKGLIHRDLKPSNLLVVDDGGTGQPRVIDFGIAKAIDQLDGDQAYATRLGEAVGTPEYMSPEQASLGEMDIDTRSDVYALGLVLYQLLTGRLPIDPETLESASFGEICRRVRDDAVTAPSRLPASQDLTIDTRALRGDLDLVLLKALAKDREQRYESAAALADDLRRFLAHQPVLAAPPSLGYRTAKFVRRNRVAVAAAAVVVLALFASTVVAGLGLLEARESERRAVLAAAEAEQARQVAESTSEFLIDLFTSADPRAQPGELLTARDLLERGIERVDALDDQPWVQAQLLHTLGDVSWSLGDFETAEGLLQRALALHTSGLAGDELSEAIILNRLSGLDRDRADLEGARNKLERALMLVEGLGMSQSREASNVLNNLGIVLVRMNQLDEAAEIYEQALAILETQIEQNPDDNEAWRSNIPNLRLNLSGVYFARGDIAAARDETLAALAQMEVLYSPEHTYLAVANNNIGRFYAMLGDLDQALIHAERAVAINRIALGPEHPTLADNLLGLGQVLLRLGQFEASEQALLESLAIYQNRLGAENYRATRPMGNLGLLYLASGRAELAWEYLAETERILAAAEQPGARLDRAVVMRRMALAASQLDRHSEARQLAEAIIELSEPLAAEHQAAAYLLLAWLLLDEAQPEAALQALEQALQLAACDDQPCMLDRADEVLTRSHWWARNGQADAAFQALELAVRHPYWTGWMLGSETFQPLRQDPRWPALEAELAARFPVPAH